MRRHEGLLTGLLLFVSAASGDAAPREWNLPIPEPRQLVGVETRLDPKFNERSGGDSTPFIVVDLGEAMGPLPAFKPLQEWTVIGADGWVHAQFVDIEKRCEYLCGTEEESESCYYVAILARKGDAADIGRPLAAVPGAFDLLEYTALAPERLASPEAVLKPTDQYTGLFENEDYRVIAYDGDALKFALRYQSGGNEHVHEIEVADCSAQVYGYFKLMSINCNGVSVLSGGAPLIVSQPDYNIPKAIPLAEFTFGNTRYYVVRYGSKAEDIIGLVAAAPSGWRGLFKGRERALLC